MEMIPVVGLKRLNLVMVNKILSEIQEKGKCKRTHLALSCKLPYDRFTKYMGVMLVLELLSLESNAEGIFVNITDLGKRFLDHEMNSPHK